MDIAEHAGTTTGEQEAGVDITIEEVRDPARLVAIEGMQMDVWGMTERDIVPANLLQIIGSSGGIVLAAYDRSAPKDQDGRAAVERPVGFVLGLLGRRDDRLYHASHMLATVPAYRGRGIGERLKRRQRELATAQGLSLMTWTFDPLVARNAYFNLHKLGATSSMYYEDYYGAMDDQLNSGLPTDRLLVEWRLRDAAPPPPALQRASIPILADEGGTPLLRIDRLPDGAPLAVRVPADIARVKDADPDRASAWRLALRQALSWAFARGYRARDFVDGAYVLLADDSP